MRITLKACLAVSILSAVAISPAAARVDTTPIGMTAQDGTGMVWATPWPPRPGELYRWQDGGWTPAHVQMPDGGIPVGVWAGPEGGVVVVFRNFAPGAAIAWYRGGEYKLLGKLEGGLSGLRVLSTPPDNLWITANGPNIYQLAPGGVMRVVYTFSPGQFFAYRHVPGGYTADRPLEATTDGRGRTWFWSTAAGAFINAAIVQGFLIYDGHTFAYHRSIEGLPHRPLSCLGRADGKHLWAATLGGGMYSINTESMAAERIREPEPDAFARVTKIFRSGTDIYVVDDPRTGPAEETLAHRLTSVLWRYRKGQWKEILTGIDDLAEPADTLNRPWLASKAGMWLGANASGLWFIPSGGQPPRLIDWRQGFPLDSVNALYRLGPRESAKRSQLLAVELKPGRAAGVTPASLLAPVKRSNVEVINPYTSIQPDQQHRLWGILSLNGHALSEWGGEKWMAHPLPGNISPAWLSGLDADQQGRVWLFPDCRQGPISIFNARHESWANYPSYQAALEAQNGAHVRFVNAADDRMKPIYGPGRQIAFMGACRGINYFNGQTWRLWNRRDVPGDPGYFFDGPAFFDSNGRLAVNIHHETLETTPDTGWHLIPYQPGTGERVQWFVPNPPGKTPEGCTFNRSTSLSRDRLGRSWWTWDGNVYAGVAGLCREWFTPGEPQPFIDGRLLRRVLVDSRGSVFFETLIANHRVGEYVIYSPHELLPRASLHVTQLSPDSVRLNFTSSLPGKVMYSWRVDGGSWSAPQSERSTVLHQLPGGEHRIEAEAVDSRLLIGPVPVSTTVDINVNPQQQMAGLLAQLGAARSDDQREAAVEAIERQPAAIALPALRAAQVQANETEGWWIDAAIQALTQRK